MKDVSAEGGLAEMTNLGVPVLRVHHQHRGVQPVLQAPGKAPQDVKTEVAANLAKLERRSARSSGSEKPLLVSVRSGEVLHAGMMDTSSTSAERQDGRRARAAVKNPGSRTTPTALLMMFSTSSSTSQEQLRAPLRREEAGARRGLRRRPYREDLMDLCGNTRRWSRSAEEGVPAGPLVS